MGMAKDQMMEEQERGWSGRGTTICSECVTDMALAEAIRDEGGTEPCDYCEHEPVAPTASASFDLLLELVVEGINTEYGDPDNEGVGWSGRDGGYQLARIIDTYDLLSDLDITEDPRVFEDLWASINSQREVWCQRDPYAPTPAEALTWGWEALRELVKTKRRFTFMAHDDSGTIGAGEIPLHAVPAAVVEAVRAARLTTAIYPGTAWWRARVHPSGERYGDAASLGTPPSEFARDNRMSPKGIGAFYGASTADGARAEVAGYADSDEEASIGCFTSIRPMTVVDLRDIPEVPSIFDQERRYLRAPTQFLRGFVRDITAIADPDDKQNLDYVPTQIVAEQFRYELEGPSGEPIDGVIWRSSKNRDVTACVLFVPSDQVADAGSETNATRLVLDPTSVAHISAPL